MYCPSPAEFIQVRVEKGLGADRERPQACLQCRVRIRGAGPVRRILREMGEALSGYHTAVGERVGGIRAVPAVRPGNKDGALHHERDRYLGSSRGCSSCWSWGFEGTGFAWWTWLSTAVHHADFPEEACLFSGCSCPPRRLSRGRFWETMISRSARSSGIWRI